MKKLILLGFAFTSLVSCKTLIRERLKERLNKKFAKIGAFDEKIQLTKIANAKKEIVYFPMVHLSTKEFYADVQHKIDSLKEKGYFFLYETVKNKKKDPTVIKKMRKIGFSNLKYSKILDSLILKKYNITLKKPIIDQPMSEELGLTEENSINADITAQDFIILYEKKNGEIKLTPCEQRAKTAKEMVKKCKGNYSFRNGISKETKNDITLNSRNKILIEHILKTPHRKLAILYGKNHWKEVEKILKEKHQFKEVK